MRKAILVLIMFVPLLAHAQNDYASFAVEGKTWKGYHETGNFYSDETTRHYCSYQVRGDTVVGGKTCKKIYNYSTLSYIVYEEGGKVYIWYGGLNKFMLIFDFSLIRRDTCRCMYSKMGLFEVVGVDSVMAKGRKYKRMKVKDDWGYYDGQEAFYWIEGIGGSFELFQPGSIAPAAPFVLQSCELNGEVLFDETDKINATRPFEFSYNDYDEFVPGQTWQLDSETDGDLVRQEELKLGDYTFSFIKDDTFFPVSGTLPGLMRVYIRNSQNGGAVPEDWTATDSYVFQMKGRVYLHDGITKKIPLIMDFTLEPGEVFRAYDVINVDNYVDYQVISVSDTILYASSCKSRRCIYLQNVKQPQDTDIWIEGIGSLKYGLLGYRKVNDDASSQLMSCSDNNQILFKRTESTVPVSSVRSDSLIKGKGYDLQGRQLTEQSMKGVYIRDGRKIVAK